MGASLPLSPSQRCLDMVRGLASGVPVGGRVAAKFSVEPHGMLAQTFGGISMTTDVWLRLRCFIVCGGMCRRPIVKSWEEHVSAEWDHSRPGASALDVAYGRAVRTEGALRVGYHSGAVLWDFTKKMIR